MEGGKIRVLVVDDHEVVRVGLAVLLRRYPEIEVIAEASSGLEAVKLAEEHEPDVVVMDIRMPDWSGVEACREIVAARPGTRVIMLTSYADEEAVMASVVAGASGYLLKQIRSTELAEAIRTVAHGGSLLDPSVTERVFAKIREWGSRPSPKSGKLTPQERKIVPLIAEGKTNREIAREVFLSEKTVRNYVSSILAKLGVENRTQIAVIASTEGLARDDDDADEPGAWPID